MKEKNLILSSLAIPILFYITVEIRGILEYCFKMSEKYHYIYTYGSMFFLLIQLLLLFVSFYIGLHVIVNRREYKLKTKIISFLAGSSVFLAMVIFVAYCLIRDHLNS